MNALITFTFKETAKVLPKVVVSFLHLYEEFHLLYILGKTWCGLLIFKNFSFSNGCIVITEALICLSLVTEKVEQLFMLVSGEVF